MWRAQQVNGVIVKRCARVVGCFAGFGQVWNFCAFTGRLWNVLSVLLTLRESSVGLLAGRFLKDFVGLENDFKILVDCFH